MTLSEKWRAIAGLPNSTKSVAKLDEAKSSDNFLLIADHRDLSDSSATELRKGLKKLGIFSYDVPGTKGTDTFCIVFSKRTMSAAELKTFIGS